MWASHWARQPAQCGQSPRYALRLSREVTRRPVSRRGALGKWLRRHSHSISLPAGDQHSSVSAHLQLIKLNYARGSGWPRGPGESSQSRPLRYHWREGPQVSFLSRHNESFVCGKYTFAVTKDVFCRNRHVFVATKKDTCGSSRQFSGDGRNNNNNGNLWSAYPAAPNAEQALV